MMANFKSSLKVTIYDGLPLFTPHNLQIIDKNTGEVVHEQEAGITKEFAERFEEAVLGRLDDQYTTRLVPVGESK